MYKPLKLLARAAAVIVIVATLPLLLIASDHPTSFASGPGGHGCNAGNLIPNCGMDQFVPAPQGEAPAGWTPFVLSGGAAMDRSPDTYWGAPSLRIWSDGGTFVAGIYTQVGGLTPGATYYASVGWFAPTEPDAFARRLGIDPTGGTDPNSPAIVWGPAWRGPGRVLNDTNPGAANIDVSAVARGTTVTVYAWVDHNYSTGPNQIFIDALGLYQDVTAVVAVAPSATPAPEVVAPTSAPTTAKAAAGVKTNPPTKLARTATAVSTATANPTALPSDTPAPTSTPSPTATATLTPTPQDTATPTLTPTSTLPPRPRATSIAAATQVSAATSPPQALLLGGIGALAGAGLLSIGMMRRHR